jgi:uncharacterized protein YaiE (UPF0345 family)
MVWPVMKALPTTIRTVCATCRAEASERDSCGDVGLLERLGHLGIDRPGCDSIDGDPVLGEACGIAASETFESGLGGVVMHATTPGPRAAAEEMLTIRPQRRVRMPGNTAWVQRKADLRFTMRAISAHPLEKFRSAKLRLQ